MDARVLQLPWRIHLTHYTLTSLVTVTEPYFCDDTSKYLPTYIDLYRWASSTERLFPLIVEPLLKSLVPLTVSPLT